tara:strand:- start:9335 stop:9544 length:210 start_codon:yes stop_codon:yes gene_type:complete
MASKATGIDRTAYLERGASAKKIEGEKKEEQDQRDYPRDKGEGDLVKPVQLETKLHQRQKWGEMATKAE